MTYLTTTDLLDYYAAFEVIDDDIFIEEKNFVLEELYSFEFSSNVKGLFWYDSESTEAKLIKLSGQYYLVGVAPCDEYRDNRSDIYQIRCEKMDELLFKKDIFNEIPGALEVEVGHSKDNDFEGLVFTITHYANKTPLLSLVTINDDYYPKGRLEYNKTLHMDALPIVEQYLLNHSLSESTQKKKNTFKI